jgi:hypothetical protein
MVIVCLVISPKLESFLYMKHRSLLVDKHAGFGTRRGNASTAGLDFSHLERKRQQCNYAML